jgi:hypothetical protein
MIRSGVAPATPWPLQRPRLRLGHCKSEGSLKTVQHEKDPLASGPAERFPIAGRAGRAAARSAAGGIARRPDRRRRRSLIKCFGSRAGCWSIWYFIQVWYLSVLGLSHSALWSVPAADTQPAGTSKSNAAWAERCARVWWGHSRFTFPSRPGFQTRVRIYHL